MQDERELPAPDDVDAPVDEPYAPEGDESEAAAVVVPTPEEAAEPDATAEEEDDPEEVVGEEELTDEEAAPGAAPSIRICRTIRAGTQGADVVAVKRALSRAGFMRWGTFTTTWGEFAVEACKAFQREHGIPTTGTYGKRTHDVLLRTRRRDTPGEWAWDDYGAGMLREFCELSGDDRVRKAIVAAAKYWNRHRDAIGYRLDRPFPVVTPPGIPNWSDCSGFVTICHKAGGAARNPNVEAGRRLPWNGRGYTGTLLDGGRRCERHELKPGDLVFYGFTTTPKAGFPLNSPTHVALWLGDGMVMTHGKKEGPELKHYAYWSAINCYVTYDVT